MIKAIMIGDSALYGSMGPGIDLVNERLVDHPQLVLNREQSVFDFCYNYSKPGASYAGIFSPDPATRAKNGLPNGAELNSTLANTDAGAVLILLGGNDFAHKEQLPSYVKLMAQACIANNKLFAFVGPPDINATASYVYQHPGVDFYSSNYPQVVAELSAAVELIRQTCIHEGYIYLDTRNNVLVNWATCTGDFVHPSQEYSQAIFTYVAKSIGGS